MSEWDEVFEEPPRVDRYLETPGLNWSTLKLMDQSPLALQDALAHGRGDTEWMLLGRAIHCYALERSEFHDRYAVAPHFGDGRTKAAKKAKTAFLNDASGREVVSHQHWITVQACGEALAKHKVARKLLEGKREHIATWTHSGTGIACKGRMDVVGERVVDLKSTGLQSERLIFSDAASRLYYGQGAWYHDGATTAGLIRPNAPLPANVWVQTCRPYDVLCAEMEEETYLAGLRLYERLLAEYQGCMATDWWPGMAPELKSWRLPVWARETS